MAIIRVAIIVIRKVEAIVIPVGGYEYTSRRLSSVMFYLQNVETEINRF